MNIEVRAYGSTKPVASGRDSESLEINRRTIVTVIKE
jgi:outer membrane protein OmpA-like peptidoglycan-associated protein